MQLRALLFVFAVASTNALLFSPGPAALQRSAVSRSAVEMFAGAKKVAPKKTVKKAPAKKVAKKVAKTVAKKVVKKAVKKAQAKKQVPGELSPLAQLFSMELIGGAQSGTWWTK